MFKRTVIDQIEITRDGTIQLRLAKEVVDDDGDVISTGWHRTVVPPDEDLDLQMAAVNLNLTRDLGYPEVAASDLARVQQVLPVVQTQAVKDAYVAKRASAEAAIRK